MIYFDGEMKNQKLLNLKNVSWESAVSMPLKVNLLTRKDI